MRGSKKSHAMHSPTPAGQGRKRLHSLVALAVVSLATALSGCAFDKYKVEQVDYGSDQSSAQILIGDPQIYARASLINDRRAEVLYLKQLLENSRVDSDGHSRVDFSPQVVRDLKTVQVMTASVGLDVGAKLGASPSVDDLNQQIAVAKLQAQLAILKKQAEGIEAAAPPATTILAAQTTDAAPGTPPSTSYADVSAIRSAIKDVQGQLAALKSVGAPSTPITSFSGLGDPRGDFADRQAYRRDIRAALSEAQLDDVHDRGGNALYRLQFQATVLPPSGNSRQWGAAKLYISPPALYREQVWNKYINWLTYISANLIVSTDQGANRPSAKATHNYAYDQYVLQLAHRGYFTVVDVYSSGAPGSSPRCLQRDTATQEQVLSIQKQATAATRSRSGYVKAGTFAVPPTLGDSCGFYAPGTENSIDSSAPYASPDLLDFISSSFKSDLKPVQSSRATPFSLSFAFPHTLSKGRALADEMQWMPTQFCMSVAVDRTSGQPLTCESIPTGWLNAVNDRLPTTPSQAAAAGGNPSRSDYAIRSYSVLPVELSQRLGVTTDSSQSLQTALSVAAQVSTAVKSSLDAGFLRQSEARAQAVSRQPLVIGYAGSASSRESAGYFGWLFGPQYEAIEPNTFTLRQVPRSYGVSADISVPGWWDSVDLEIGTAWVKSWAKVDGEVFDSKQSTLGTVKSVRFPLFDTVYDALTDFIAAKELGQQYSRVFASGVQPDVIPACASQQVTLQIAGANIWRANSVFLGGAQAKEIVVMPDMRGIAATFAPGDVFDKAISSSRGLQSVPLVVAAEQGTADPLSVLVIGKDVHADGVICHATYLAPSSVLATQPTVVDYVPKSICSDTKEFPLQIEGLNLPARLSGEAEKFAAAEVPSDPAGIETQARTQIVRLKAKSGASLYPGETISVLLLDGKASTGLSVDLAVRDCKPAKSAPQKTPQASQTTTPKSAAKNDSTPPSGDKGPSTSAPKASAPGTAASATSTVTLVAPPKSSTSR